MKNGRIIRVFFLPYLKKSFGGQEKKYSYLLQINPSDLTKLPL